MIVVKPSVGSPFERAYFVLRRDRPPTVGAREDMVREAHRILSESERSRCRTGQGGTRLGWLWFGLGSCSGAVLMGLLWLLL